MPKHPEKVAAERAREIGNTFIKVKNVTQQSHLYTMPIGTFIANASRVD